MERAASDLGRRVFVGRSGERAAIAQAIAQAAEGRGSLLLVHGEAGIGKTSTVEEALRTLPRDRVLWGRCPDASGAPAYWPWIQALRRHLDAIDDDRLRAETRGIAADLVLILPELATRLPDAGRPGPVATDPDQARFSLFDSLLRWLGRVTDAGPLALVLDDLHWADTESLLLATFVGAEIAHTRILLIGTYRDHDVRKTSTAQALLADLGRSARRLPLAGLGRDEVEELVRASGEHVDPERIGEIHEATGGNPFFLNEIVALLGRETGGAGGAARLPDGVREALRRRLDILLDEERALLEVAAVVGQEFTLPIVVPIAAQPIDSVLDLLARPIELGMVGSDERVVGGHRFAHALVREAILAGLAPGRRAELHRRAADALTRHHQSDPSPPLGAVAEHLLRAGDAESLVRAVDVSVDAARQAQAALGYEEAAGHYERALTTLRTIAAGADVRLPILLEHGEVQARAGDFEGSKATFLEAAQSARRLGSPVELARAAIGYGMGRNQTGYIDTTLTALLDEAAEALGASEPGLRSLLLGRLSTALYFTPQEDRRLALSRESLELARAVDDPVTLATVLVHHHNILRGPGTLAERRAVAEEAVAAATAGRSAGVLCEAHMSLLLDHFESGDLAAVERELETVERLSAERRLPHPRWHAMVTRAALILRAGRFEEAEATSTAALSVPFAGRTRDAFQFFSGQLFNIRRSQGRLGDLVPTVRRLVEESPNLPIWRCALTLACAESGEPEEARRHLEGLAARRFRDLPCDINWLPGLVTLADACALLEDEIRAAWLYDTLLPQAGRHVVVGTQVSYLGPVRRYLGLLAVVMGEHEAACEHLEAALVECDAMGAPAERARTEAALAAALEGRGRTEERERVRELREAARATVRSLGMGSVVAFLDPPSRVVEGPTRGAAIGVSAGPGGHRGEIVREGDVWRLSCDGEATRLKHVKGLSYLATLLAHPDREFHALELADGPTDDGRPARAGDSGEMLDRVAVEAYRARLRDLAEELEDATDAADLGRAERARAEIDALEGELSRALRLDGRIRRAGSEAERARLNVTRAITSVVRKLRGDCPILSRHLETAVRTGLFCVYQPDPGFGIEWRTDSGPPD